MHTRYIGHSVFGEVSLVLLFDQVEDGDVLREGGGSGSGEFAGDLVEGADEAVLMGYFFAGDEVGDAGVAEGVAAHDEEARGVGF